MPRKFVSEPLEPAGGSLPSAPGGFGEPLLPAAFLWRGERLAVRSAVRGRRGLKVDRGDVYLKRHYYEFELEDGRVAVAYFSRDDLRWWLYTISEPQ